MHITGGNAITSTLIGLILNAQKCSQMIWANYLTVEPTDNSTLTCNRSVHSRHRHVRITNRMGTATTTGIWHRMVNWLVVSHTDYCRVEPGDYEEEMPGCSMGTVATVTLSGTQPLRYMHRPRHPELITDISGCLGEISKMAIMTTQIQLQGSLPPRHHALGTRRTMKYSDRSDWQDKNQNSFDKELPILVIDESEEKEHVESKDFDQYQPDSGLTGNRMDDHGKET